jgi:phosphopentomutase
MNKRSIILVLDGAGIGPAPESAQYGDAGAATLPHVGAAVGGLALPNLERWGLGWLAAIPGVQPVAQPAAAYGRLRERAAGKDSTTGHWELAGLVLEQPFPTYPGGFPSELVRQFEATIGRPVLGNVAASGTEIIERLGEEHVRTGQPILYTSADSVFQLAAHEEVVPVEQLYDWCRRGRALLTGDHAVGRVIARPFAGPAGAFRRTVRRHDFSLPPPAPTLLDAVAAAGDPVVAIGKVADLFAGRGVTETLPTQNNAGGISALQARLAAPGGGLIFATLVDFDTLYGHRNDAPGFARALAEFDASLPALEAALRPGDLLLLTADHGNDPTTPGTDHTRELVPLLARSPTLPGGTPLGTRTTFADVAATAAEWLGLEWDGQGSSFGQALGVGR